LTGLLCFFSLLTLAQGHFRLKPADENAFRNVDKPKPRVQISIPDMPRGAAKAQEAASKPVARKNAVQMPMTVKYVQSGMMKVPVFTGVAKRKKSSKKLLLEHADLLSFDGYVHPDYQVLSGKVRFRHEGAVLFSDSAHYYSKTNSLYAFGNVHMEQGDTLFLYGAWLFYDGSTKLVQVREKVRLENRKVTLFTDSLNYDRNSNLGYFFDGGLLVDEANELSSEYGQYSPETKLANFQNDVKLVHPKFVMTNKELTYNTQTHVADIAVPTDIVSGGNYVYTTKGNYNTLTDKCVLYNRSYVLSDHRKLTGDTVNYDSKRSVGEAFGNVVLVDTVQRITMVGGYGYSAEKEGYGMMTREPLMIDHSQKDTLWLHADTLISAQDSIYKVIKAYHGVRFFRNDFQGLSDSLYYCTKDSILSLYHNPILWSDRQQITGETIHLHTRNNKPYLMHIQRSAMLVQQETDSLYNQTSGKDLKAYFDSSEVVKVEIRGNAETVYLPREKNDVISGLNRLEGSSLDVYRKHGKLRKLVVWPEPKGKYYPLALIEPQARYLSNFAWYADARPQSPEDIFREWAPATVAGTRKKSTPTSAETSKTATKPLKPTAKPETAKALQKRPSNRKKP
jgi:lipopolysaccharide export system protein LptA